MAENSTNTKAKAQEPSKLAKFWAGTKAEFRKIEWPDRNDMLKQSVAVVGVSIALGVLIAIFDMVIQYGVDFLVR